MSSVRTEICLQGASGAHKEADQLVVLYKRADFQNLNTVLEGLQSLLWYDGKTTGSLNATLRNIANWGQSARAHARLRVKHHLRPHGMLVHLATAAPQRYLLLGAIRIRKPRTSAKATGAPPPRPGPRPPLARRHRAVTSLAEARRLSGRRRRRPLLPSVRPLLPSQALLPPLRHNKRRAPLRRCPTPSAQRRSCVMLLVLLPRAPHPEVVGAHAQSCRTSAATVAAAVAAAAAAAAVSAAVVALLFGYLYI